MYSQKMDGIEQGLDYRPDIDGLRAIAVVSVILFHFNREWIPGGFIGVDVFFVISGFLITQLLRKGLLKGKFTFSDFYVRRIRRIAPALIAMLIATSIAAFILLRPYELRSFAISLGSQVVSLQNIFFLSEGEYFIGAESKPLLHTWSLAVEEQFYLLWPLLLLLTRNWGRQKILLALFSLIAASFVLNLLAIQISPKSSFFLLPTRAWELGLGGITAILLERRAVADVLNRYSMVIGWVGVIFLAFSFALINSDVPFPGVAAVFPVVGTVLLISCHQPRTSFLGRILTNKYVVYTGLLSYGLYLWHWPILAFAHYFEVNLHGYRNASAAFLLIVFFSYFSYRYLEIPIRLRRFFPTTASLVSAAALSVAGLLLLSVHFWSTQGAAYRYDTAARPFLTAGFNSRSDRCGFSFRVFHPRDEVCQLNKIAAEATSKSVLLWGNSHADMWTGMLLNLADANHALLSMNAKNCRSTTDSSFCDTAVQNRIVEYIVRNKISDVILASTWYGSYDLEDADFERSLRDVVERLTSTNANIWLIIDVPVSRTLNPLSSYVSNPKAPIYGVVPTREYENASKGRELRLFKSIASQFDRVKIVDVSNAFCSIDYCTSGAKGEVWYRDDNHITDAGALAAKDYFLPIFK